MDRVTCSGSEPFVLVNKQDLPVGTSHPVENGLSEIKELLPLGLAIVEKNLTLVITVKLNFEVLDVDRHPIEKAFLDIAYRQYAV